MRKIVFPKEMYDVYMLFRVDLSEKIRWIEIVYLDEKEALEDAKRVGCKVLKYSIYSEELLKKPKYFYIYTRNDSDFPCYIASNGKDMYEFLDNELPHYVPPEIAFQMYRCE